MCGFLPMFHSQALCVDTTMKRFELWPRPSWFSCGSVLCTPMKRNMIWAQLTRNQHDNAQTTILNKEIISKRMLNIVRLHLFLLYLSDMQWQLSYVLQFVF